ncbi:MAG TPA: hypothetical protein VF401_00395 [Candidatus Saccharimonadales bacterium]
MKISEQILRGKAPAVVVEFEYAPGNGLHEAYVALNAIAARNRKAFDKANGPRGQDLKSVTQDLLGSGMDSFVNAVQTAGREKSREGVLTESLRIQADKGHINYLHTALVEYRKDTIVAVTSEMRSAMGNQAALTRTFEAVTADAMAHAIEESYIEINHEEPKDRQPFGFGRALTEAKALAW